MKSVVMMIPVAMMLLVFTSCEKTEEEKAKIAVERLNVLQERTPTGATEVKDVGNGWCTFSWQDRQFLYQFQNHRSGSKGYQSAAIVELSQK